MNENKVWEIDRSRVLDWQSCPRKRFYGYHFNGKGLQKISKSLPLVFGDAFHQGAEIFLPGGDVEIAVQKAINFLNLTFSINGVDLGNEKATTYGIEEQKAIAEGLIRAWVISKRDEFLENFEVLEVEQEGRAELEPGMWLMFRPDALVREKLTGDLYICSWKTASTFGQYTINSINTDVQSMSECWGWIEERNQRMKEGAKQLAEQLNTSVAFGTNGDARIEGVLYLFCVKGQRRMDDYLGLKTQDTHLAYGWMRPGVTEDETEWAFRYKWPSEEEEKKFSQLGKGFRKVSIWDNYPGGVKAWIDDLHNRRITPRHIDPFEAIFPQSLPVSRRADEIESWKRQTISAEGRVRQRVRAVEMEPTPEVLDREFPQHTARCFDYQSKCQFFEICFTSSIGADPIGSGLYQIRTSNHPEKGGEE